MRSGGTQKREEKKGSVPVGISQCFKPCIKQYLSYYHLPTLLGSSLNEAQMTF